MTRRRRFPRWLIGAAILLGGYYLYQHDSGPLTVAAALRDGAVNARIVADGADGTSVTITLTLPSEAAAPVAVDIPSGTVIYGGEAGSQRLITAVPVTIVLSSASPSASARVSTFCIDEFAPPPTSQAALTFVPSAGTGGATTEETEPLHKLADCMSGWPQSDGDKQLAIWAVAGDMLHKPRAEALRFMTDGLVRQMVIERRAQLESKRAAIEQMAPDLSEEHVDQLIEREMRDGMPALRRIAATTADDQLRDFLTHDKDMLSGCGYAAADMPVFQ